MAPASSPSPPASGPIVALLRRCAEWSGELALLLGRTLAALFRGRVLPGETLRQMSAIGVSSVPLAILTVAFSGMVLAFHTTLELRRFGVEGLIGQIVVTSMAREAAPVLTAIVVASRVGSAIAAEIGTMVVTEQVDALRSLGVSPIQYLVVPRFLAGILMLPVLTVFGNAAGVLGAYLVAVYQAGVNSHLFINSARNCEPSDLFLGLAKTVVFGAIIALVGCYQGLRTRGGAAGVGRSTTAAVVTGIVFVYIADYFMAPWLFNETALRFQ